MRLTPILFMSACAACVAAPKSPYVGPDFSGIYNCKGEDSHEGPYTSTVTLELVRSQSVGKFGAYSFKMEVPGYGIYLGHAAADGQAVAIHFALTDPAPKDYGTGLARFSKAKSGKWQFTKYYYEPEFKGGNYGTESCVQK